MSAYKFAMKDVNDNETIFNCFVTAYVCKAVNKNGTRCKRTTTIGSPYCYTHLLYKKHIKIKPSTIPNAGKGVFAVDPKRAPGTIIFRNGDVIIPYASELITTEDRANRYGPYTAPYAVQLSNQYARDGACDRGIGSLINHRPQPGQQNVEFAVNNRTREVNIKAIKNIRNGEELFASYGPGYNFNDNTTHTTKMAKRE